MFIQWTLFILNSQELRASRFLRDTVCVTYVFIGEMIFCWNHYRYGFLKSLRVSKRIISKIHSRNKNKNFGRSVSCKYLKC